MKKLYVLLCLITYFTVGQAQNSSCCASPDKFSDFSSDMAFVNSHLNPIPFNFIEDKGKMMQLAAADGKAVNVYAIKSTEKSDKYLIVVHEWWGLNGYIKQVSEKLFKDLGGMVNVLAIDFYDGQVADTRDSATVYMNSVTDARANTIMQTVINQCGTDAKISAIGWCFGGGYALQTSLLAKENGVGTVMYYGFPETDKEKLSTLNGDVLMIWPSQDKWITAKVVDQFKADMQILNKKLTVEAYDADHAFANPSNPKYQEAMADDAYYNSLKFLKRSLDLK